MDDQLRFSPKPAQLEAASLLWAAVPACTASDEAVLKQQRASVCTVRKMGQSFRIFLFPKLGKALFFINLFLILLFFCKGGEKKSCFHCDLKGKS